ncbi:DUF6985 domain-containing protein [Marinobacter sp. CA1]|uniref:DUF6985 domain-containing protein n=1 Tax=Marinobacter sp. CA1 TaxID=2817656 RepID=UPI001D06EB2C|nr:hypothetical protein [Marinobacter sp. CA1]UDL07149.1 hypothetical protein J2887_10520 [Marinobacter sp. CA1]
MEINLANIIFNRVESEYDESLYDWMSEEVSIKFLNGLKVSIRLDFDDQDLQDLRDGIEQTLLNSLALGNEARDITKKHLYAYYKNFVFVAGEESLEEMPPQYDDSNILDYVHISSLSICCSQITKEFYCQFTGGCDWEEEHGVLISFRNGVEIARVGGYGHVSNADAYADASMDNYVYYCGIIKTTAL